jgi:hypothetical protein
MLYLGTGWFAVTLAHHQGYAANQILPWIIELKNCL